MSSPPTAPEPVPPIRNHYAIVAWYVGIFSFIMYIGAVLGLIAIVLGVQGLRFASRNPGSGGRVQALVGIACGLVFGGANMVAVITLILALRS